MKVTKRNKQTGKEDLSRRKKPQVLYTTYLKGNRPFLFLLQIDGIFPGVFKSKCESSNTLSFQLVVLSTV